MRTAGSCRSGGPGLQTQGRTETERQPWAAGGRPGAVLSGERGSQGRARRAPCAPVGTRCVVRGARGPLRERWARRRPRRTPPHSSLQPSPASPHRQAGLCAGGACRTSCFCVGFSFFSSSPPHLPAVIEKFPKAAICSFRSINRNVPAAKQCPAAGEPMRAGCGGHRNVLFVTLQKTNS